MKNYLIIFLIVGYMFACNSNISDSPIINLTSASIIDSVYEDSIVTLQCNVTSIDEPLHSFQIKHNNSIVFDTILPQVREFEYMYSTTLFGYKDLQTLQIIAYNTEELYSSVSKQFFVRQLASPSILFDEGGVYSDTTISTNQTINFLFACKQANRPLDSLIVSHNSNVVFRFPNSQLQTFTDSVTIVPYSCAFSEQGTYILNCLLRDKATKSTSKQIKITVTN